MNVEDKIWNIQNRMNRNEYSRTQNRPEDKEKNTQMKPKFSGGGCSFTFVLATGQRKENYGN